MSEPQTSPLQEDWLTAWVPDIGANFDAALFASHTMEGAKPLVQWLRLPKTAGQSMLVPVLHPSAHVELHRTTDPIREMIGELLSPGVFGYRRGAREGERYSDNWQLFTAATREQASEAATVVFADIRSFFPSTPWQLVTSALKLHFSLTETDDLLQLVGKLTRSGLTYLPPGYSDARMLANVVLHQIDSSLELPFVRWVDDYRLFLPADRDPETIIDSLDKVLGRIGLALNKSKTRYLPSTDVISSQRNDLAEAYDPEHQSSEEMRRALRALLERALSDPVAERRTLRFVLARLGKTGDDIAVNFALQALNDLPWEAPRLISYLALFAESSSVRRAVEERFRAALSADDGWLICRIAPFLMATGVADATAEMAEARLAAAAGTPAWASLVRLLAQAGRTQALIRATFDDVPDPRAALIALADLDLPLPERLARLEPLTAQALAEGRAPLPSLRSLL